MSLLPPLSPNHQPPATLQHCPPGTLQSHSFGHNPGSGDAHLLQHTLNRDKQTRSLLANTIRPDVVFEISPNKENVNVRCSPGFYQQIAKPAFSTLTKGFTFDVSGINLSCSIKTTSKDQTGVTERVLLKFNFVLNGVPGLIAVHLYHTSQLIQVQGSMVMPDMNSAAVWFVKHALEERFRALSKSQHYSIKEFHAALHALSQSTIPSPSPFSNTLSSSLKISDQTSCDDCKKTFSTNSKPVPCLICDATVHSSCFRSHNCSSNILTEPAQNYLARPALKHTAADITAFEDSDDDDEQVGNPSTLPLIQEIPPFPSLSSTITPACTTRPPPKKSKAAPVNPPLSNTLAVMTTSVCTVSSFSNALSSASINIHPLLTNLDPTAPPFINPPAISLPMAFPLATDSAPSTFMFTASQPSSSLTISPPASTSTSSITKKAPPKKKSKSGPPITPESVKLDYLQQEINIAQTKITSLEAQNKDKDDKIKILEAHIKAIEDPRVSSMFSNYFPDPQTNPPPPPTPQIHDFDALSTEISILKSQVSSLQTTLHPVLQHLSLSAATTAYEHPPAPQPSTPPTQQPPAPAPSTQTWSPVPPNYIPNVQQPAPSSQTLSSHPHAIPTPRAQPNGSPQPTSGGHPSAPATSPQTWSPLPPIYTTNVQQPSPSSQTMSSPSHAFSAPGAQPTPPQVTTRTSSQTPLTYTADQSSQTISLQPSSRPSPTSVPSSSSSRTHHNTSPFPPPQRRFLLPTPTPNAWLPGREPTTAPLLLPPRSIFVPSSQQ